MFPRLRAHAYILPVMLAAIAVFCWMVTFGTWRLFDTETFTSFYDAQALSLLHGHWDVPPEAITFESFVRDGKNYGYFGFVPAIMRMPLMLLAPASQGHWSRLSLLVCYVLSLLLAYRLVLRLRLADAGTPGRWTNAAYAGFVLLAGLSSTLIFLGARSFTYHEALMWGAAFALACYYQVVRYLADPRGIRLALACAFACLAFFSRASSGAGAVFALMLLASNIAATRWLMPPVRQAARGGLAGVVRALLRPLAELNRWGDGAAPPSRHAWVAAATALAVFAGYVGVNYVKFRTFLDGTPMHLYHEVQADPNRLKGTNGKQLRLVNVRSGLHAYLAPDNLLLRPSFPWTMLVPMSESQLYAEAKYSVVEPHASVTATAPALFCLALVGIRARRRRVGVGTASSSVLIPLLGAFAGALPVFAADGLTERYVHDLFPFLVFAGALGVNEVFAFRRAAARRLFAVVLIPLGVWGIYVSCTTALMYQRSLVWGCPPERSEAYLELTRFIDEHVSVKLFGAPEADGTGR